MSKFLLAPPSPCLSQMSESVGGSVPQISRFTRRKFLKRSGGATLAAFAAWNLAVRPAHAFGEGEASGSETYVLENYGSPALPFKITASLPFDLLVAKLELELVASASGPTGTGASPIESSSFSWSASSIKAKSICTARPFDGGSTDLDLTAPFSRPVSASGGGAPSLSWSHGTHTAECSTDGDVTHTKASPITVDKTIFASYDLGDSMGCIVSVYWKIRSEIHYDNVYIRSVEYDVMATYTSPSGVFINIGYCYPPGVNSGHWPTSGAGPRAEFKWRTRRKRK
jgi:hypothetical protein